MFYLGVYFGNYEEGISFMIFFFLNNTVTEIIKRLLAKESLWEVTRRPEGAFNTDYFSRNGPAVRCSWISFWSFNKYGWF